MRTRLYGILAIAAVLVYGTLFSVFTVLRHNAFQSAAWDLGVFNQAFYTTLYEGKLFHYTPDLFFSPSGSLFAIHISPVLFLLLPFYAVSPHPETLLVVKSFALAFAAFPLYLLTKETTKNSKAAFMLTLVYLLYPPLQGANWFDFQQSAFLPLLFFSTYYFMTRKNWKFYFPTMLLTLMVEEHIAIAVFILTILHLSLTTNPRSVFKSVKQLKVDEGSVSIATMVLCTIYFFAVMSIKNLFPVNPDFERFYRATDNFAILGINDVLSLPLYALMNPHRTLDALLYDYPFKFLYIIFLLCPLIFTPLRNRFSLGILFLLTPFLLSNYRPYYSIGVHYPFYILPMIYVAAIYGLGRLPVVTAMFNLKTMVVISLLFTISTSPLSPVAATFVREGMLLYPPLDFYLDENKKSLIDIINVIPPKASVLTQNLIFPHVSNRENAYVIPFSNYGNPQAMHEYITSLINNSEYVLLDMQSPDSMAEKVLDEITKDNSYCAYALASQAILFKRNYEESPIYAHYTEHRVFSAYDQLIVSHPGTVITDLSSESEKLVFCPKGSVGCFVFGPYMYLLQGSYEATFMVKVGEHDNSYLGTFDVASDQGTALLSVKDTYGFELKPNEWINITVPFSLQTLKAGLEFRVISGGTADMYVDRVIVNRISTDASSDFGLKTIRIRDLVLSSGNLTEEGFLVHPHNVSNEIFWFGPYMSLSSGSYKATFLLKVFPKTAELNKTLLTLSITADGGKASLSQRDLSAQEFHDEQNVSDWRSFTLSFAAENDLTNVEFKGLYPSPDYDIYLAFITVERED
jgi:uncharacterized membrane protein